MVYSFSLFMYDTEPKKDYELSEAVRACGVNDKFTNFVYIFDNTADTFLTLIIPSIGILIMNASICKSFSKHLKSKNDLLKSEKIYFKTCTSNGSMKNKDQRVEEEDQICKINRNERKYRSTASSLSIQQFKPKNQLQSANSSKHVTKTLLLVSFAFILLNSPYRASKLISYVRMSSTDNYVYSNLEYAINEVLINLYFTSYSVNFFLYSLCGKKFRILFQALVLFCFCFFYSRFIRLFRFIFRSR